MTTTTSSSSQRKRFSAMPSSSFIRANVWSRLKESLRVRLLPLALTFVILGLYRVFIAPLPPPPPPTLNYFTKTWLWVIIIAMTGAIVAGTTRSIMKNTGRKAGYGDMGSVSERNPYTYLVVAVLWAFMAVLLLVVGFYTLLFGSEASSATTKQNQSVTHMLLEKTSGNAMRLLVGAVVMLLVRIPLQLLLRLTRS